MQCVSFQDHFYKLPARRTGKGFQRGPLPGCLCQGSVVSEDRPAGGQDTGKKIPNLI